MIWITWKAGGRAAKAHLADPAVTREQTARGGYRTVCGSDVPAGDKVDVRISDEVSEAKCTWCRRAPAPPAVAVLEQASSPHTRQRRPAQTARHPLPVPEPPKQRRSRKRQPTAA
jgi:hypothetical protein